MMASRQNRDERVCKQLLVVHENSHRNIPWPGLHDVATNSGLTCVIPCFCGET
jgi:hypothetical protein